MRPKRVLWLLNHTTLREFEIPLLAALGCEAFAPKSCPQDELNLSSSVSYAYDAALTITPNLLARLNAHDFYGPWPWPADIAEATNVEFDACFCACYPDMISAACEAFRGPVLLHAFGREGNLTYAAILSLCRAAAVERVVRRDGVRLAQGFANIAGNEPDWMARVALTLPYGLADGFGAGSLTWRGGRPEILFVCPRIGTSDYYAKVYSEFKRCFGDLPHVIAGAQVVPVDDPHVTGFVPRAEYTELLRTCDVMLYTSREPRHLHYHPMEAAVAGQPLLFMAGSQMHVQAGGANLLGCCATVPEMRLKLEAILGGDRALAEAVAEGERQLAERFTRRCIEPLWRERFLPLIGEVTSSDAFG